MGEVRIQMQDGEPWFCAADVCRILGYQNARDAVHKHCRTPYVAKRDIGVVTGTKTDGSPAIQKVGMTFVNEGNLYRLITHSQMPAAEQFETWVFDEVLPTLRRSGRYQINADGIVKKYKTLPKPKSMAQPSEEDMQQLLALIDANLLTGDKANIAKELNVSQSSVIHTLHGQHVSAKILKALFDRALYNHQHNLCVNTAFVQAGIAALTKPAKFNK